MTIVPTGTPGQYPAAIRQSARGVSSIRSGPRILLRVNDPKDQREVRREYQTEPLRRRDLADDPLVQFAGWLEAATALGAKDATAMTLATVAEDGTPSVRIVLLKHFDADGYCWYTDYRSQKGVELASHPIASALFYWRDFDRQVRMTGRVEPLSDKEADDYFQGRPEASRFASAASIQSEPIRDRDSLETAVAELKDRYPDGRVPRPAEWGGYRLRPHYYEFWQGREARLHDRFRYALNEGVWRVERLQP